MKICICPGSFDPLTKGHLDIIRRCSGLFDKVIVVVMHNKQKHSTFTKVERMNFIERCTKELNNVEIDSFDGLLADYAGLKNANVIVKGLRAVSDFEYEFQQALVNKKLNNKVETLFLMSDAENMFLASSIVKQVCELGGDISAFVPPEICPDIIKKIKHLSNA